MIRVSKLKFTFMGFDVDIVKTSPVGFQNFRSKFVGHKNKFNTTPIQEIPKYRRIKTK